MITKKEFFELIGKEIIAEIYSPDKLYKTAVYIFKIDSLEKMQQKVIESNEYVSYLKKHYSGKLTPKYKQAVYQHNIIEGWYEGLLGAKYLLDKEIKPDKEFVVNLNEANPMLRQQIEEVDESNETTLLLNEYSRKRKRSKEELSVRSQNSTLVAKNNKCCLSCVIV